MSAPIIVALALREDDSAPLALGTALARLTGAPLVLAAAYPWGNSPIFLAPEATAALETDAAVRVERVAAGLRDEFEVSVYAEALAPPAFMLHELASRLGSAAVVVGSTHRGQIGRVLAGDIASALLHGLSCPVAVAPRGYTGPRDGFRRLGVGFVDNVAGHQALDAACGFARLTGGAVRSITVLDPTPWAPAMVTPGWEVPRSVESEREARAQTMAAAAHRSIPAGVSATAEVMHGEPAKTLADVSSELDLLVCGSRGYGPARAVLLGGVGRKLAHTAHCPLLVIPRELLPGIDAAWNVEPTAAAVSRSA